MGAENLNKRIVMLESMTPAKNATEQSLTVAPNSVKRSLFGRVDHQEVMAFFEEQLAQMYADNMQRWNFDFINEQPIRGGSFSWEKVASADVLKDKTSTNNVTKVKTSSKSSTITSHWTKCKKIDRRTTFTSMYTDFPFVTIAIDKFKGLFEKSIIV